MVLYTGIPAIDTDLAGYNVDDNPYETVGSCFAEIFKSGHIVHVMVSPLSADADTLFKGLQWLREEVERVFPSLWIVSIDDLIALTSCNAS